MRPQLSDLRYLCVFLTCVTSLASLRGDGDKQGAELVKVIQASHCVELFRITASYAPFHELNEIIEERFPRFESLFLSDFSASSYFDKFRGFEHASMGWICGLYFPEEEDFFEVVMPLNYGELVGHEAHSLGEDEEGHATYWGRPVLKSDHYFSDITSGDENSRIERDSGSGSNLLKFVEQNEKNVIAAAVSPTHVGRSPLKKHLMAYQIALATEAQQRDDEADFEFSWRSLCLKNCAKLIQTFFQDVESVQVTVKATDRATQLKVQLRLECRKKSGLLAYFQNMNKQRNRSLGWLPPSATSFATWRAMLPEEIRQQITESDRLSAVALREVGESPRLASQVQTAAAQLAEYGAAELLVQMVPVSETSESIVLVAPLGATSGLHSEMLQLVTGIEDLAPSADINGWPVYFVEDRLGLGKQSCLVVTDSVLVVATCNDENRNQTLELVNEVSQRRFSPAASASQIGNAFFAVRTSLSDLVTIAGDNNRLVRQFVPKEFERPAGAEAYQWDQDTIHLTAGLHGNQVFANASFERNALACGVSFAEHVLLVLALIDP